MSIEIKTIMVAKLGGSMVGVGRVSTIEVGKLQVMWI